MKQLVLLLIAVGYLAACSNKDKPQTPPPAAVTDPAAAPAPVQEAEAEISFPNTSWDGLWSDKQAFESGHVMNFMRSATVMLYNNAFDYVDPEEANAPISTKDKDARYGYRANTENMSGLEQTGLFLKMTVKGGDTTLHCTKVSKDNKTVTTTYTRFRPLGDILIGKYTLTAAKNGATEEMEILPQGKARWRSFDAFMLGALSEDQPVIIFYNSKMDEVNDCLDKSNAAFFVIKGENLHNAELLEPATLSGGNCFNDFDAASNDYPMLIPQPVNLSKQFTVQKR